MENFVTMISPQIESALSELIDDEETPNQISLVGYNDDLYYLILG